MRGHRIALVGGTALAVVASGGALAADGEKLKLSLSGFHNGFIAAIHDDTPSTRTLTFGSDSEIQFRGKGELSNGWEIGLRAELELERDGDASSGDTTNDLIDEFYVTLETPYGQVRFGQEDGAADLMHVSAPWVLGSIAASDAEISVLGISNIVTVLDESADATKLIYITPRWYGLQASISYAPDSAKNPQGLNPRSGTDGDEALEAGITYRWKGNGLKAEVGATYYTDSRESGSATERDPDHLSFGVLVEYAGVEIGGDYTFGDNLDRNGYDTNEEARVWSAGIAYENGPWRVGAMYAKAEEERMDASLEDSYTGFVAGVAYEVGPGFNLGFGYMREEADPTGSANDEDGTAFLLETRLKF